MAQRKNSQAKSQDVTVDELIDGLNSLARRAAQSNMDTASRIFYTAKEELVYWAAALEVQDVTNVNARDYFVNHHMR